MDHAACVRVRQRVEDGVEGAQQGLRARRLLPPVRQRPRGGQLHRHEGPVVVHAEVEQPRDVRVRELRGSARLSREAPPRLHVADELLANHLDRDLGAIEGRGEVDFAHGPASEPLLEMVGAERV